MTIFKKYCYDEKNRSFAKDIVIMNSSLGQDFFWIYPDIQKEEQEIIQKEFHIHPLVAQILVSRKISSLTEIRSFLYSKLPDLHDPDGFSEMKKAVKRVIKALDNQEIILIYGDNDVDGITGACLVYEFLKKIGCVAFYHISNINFFSEESYPEIVAVALEKKAQLVITVDCGITAFKDIKILSEKNIDVIITDHHEAIGKPPTCLAILNPKLPKENYPNKHLTGVGVAFKLVHGIINYLVSKKIIEAKKIDLKSFLDLVSLGTITDMGVLTGENRILVRYGIKQLQKTKRIGLLKLFSLLGLKKNEITSTDITLKVSPRINSLGRIADPNKGVELLLIKDEQLAEDLVKELDLVNLERKKIEQNVFSEVEKVMEETPSLLKNKALILSSKQWHPRVIPIISARISKQFHRPVVIISVDEKGGKGSIRTIKEFPLLGPLKKCKDLFENYGGHDYAAGVVIKKDKLNEFKKKFIHIANSSLRREDIVPKLYLDSPITFKDLDYDFLASLELLEPYGNENPQPTFYCTVKQVWSPKVFSKYHIKLFLEQDDRILEGVGFGMARHLKVIKENKLLEIAFNPGINRFQNKNGMQLLIKDFKIINSNK